MGFLDDAKDKLDHAAGWVKGRAEGLGDQAQDAGQALGEKAADARHWVESKVGGETRSEPRAAGGGEFENEWVDASADETADAPQA
jgi:hypothetical protein